MMFGTSVVRLWFQKSPFPQGIKELKAGDTWASRGFLPAGQKVPGGLSVLGELQRQGIDDFLTCSALVMSS